MDLTRDRPSVRVAEDMGRGDGRRSARSEPWRHAPRQAAYAAAAPATAADVLIDLQPRSDVPIRPVSGVGEASGSLAGVAAARPARTNRKRFAVPISLGAVAVLALVVAAILLRPELVAEPAPAAAVAPEAVAAPAGVAEATIHLRVGASLSAEERQRIGTALANAGYGNVVMHEMPFSISRSRVGYFREADRPSAEALIGALRGILDDVELRDYRTLIEAPQPGRLDLWIRS
jgi:hypothetical protein